MSKLPEGDVSRRGMYLILSPLQVMESLKVARGDVGIALRNELSALTQLDPVTLEMIDEYATIR